MTKVQTPYDQDWVPCRERLPLDVDNNCSFLVAYREKYCSDPDWITDYTICTWSEYGDNYPQHDGKRVISYRFNFDWDIDEGQNIEITHWRELPEFKGLKGELVNLSRCSHEYYQC